MINKGKLDSHNLNHTEQEFQALLRPLRVRMERSRGKIRVIKDGTILVQANRKGLLEWLQEQSNERK
jgi:hypothetical protein